MQLKKSYSGLCEEDILKMSEQEMRNSLLRLINLKTVNTKYYDSTDMFLIDDVADIIRSRQKGINEE